jgi:hypothetical protein
MKNNKLPMFIVVFLTPYLLVGCDQISEKERLEIKIRCDEAARKKFEKESEPPLMYVNSVETNYSFRDSRCYALVNTTYFESGGDGQKIKIAMSLRDGVTGEVLILEVDDDVSGSLVSEGTSWQKARELIRDYMDRR